MLGFAIFAVTFVFVLVLAVIYLYPGSAKRSTIPGFDPTDPRDGNLPDIVAAGSLHEFLLYLHAKCGPIASFWFGPKFTVSIASPELFKEQMTVFDRPPHLFELFEPLIGKCSIQFANKEEGRKRRNLYDRAFSHDSLKNYFDTFNRLGNELVEKLSAMPKDQHMPLQEHCHSVVIKGLTQTSFGDYFKDESNILKFHQCYKICWSEMESRLCDGPPEANSDRHKEFEKALGFLRSTVGNIIKERRANPTVGHQTFIDILIESDLPEEQVQDDGITYMIGGFHTSGNLLAWVLYFMASHKKVQEKLYEEIKEVVGTGNIEPFHLENLKYLRQVLEESLRVSVLAPYAARFLDNDSELGGHVVPGGTAVIHALGVVLQDEKLWPQPRKFDPERFSKEQLTARHRAAYRPFGFAGKRVCPGQNFAYMEVSVCLALICRAFKLKLVPGQVVEPNYALVTSPKEEIWVTLEKRV